MFAAPSPRQQQQQQQRQLLLQPLKIQLLRPLEVILVIMCEGVDDDNDEEHNDDDDADDDDISR